MSSGIVSANQIIDLPPDKRLMRARIQLQKKCQFIYQVLFYSKYRIADDRDAERCPIRTAFADALGNIVVFQEFIQNRPGAFIEMVLYHEAIHLVLKHPILGKGRFKGLWNIAADIKANQYVAEAGYTVPDGFIKPECSYSTNFVIDIGGIRCTIIDYKTKSAVRIYDELLEQLKKAGAVRALSMDRYGEKSRKGTRKSKDEEQDGEDGEEGAGGQGQDGDEEEGDGKGEDGQDREGVPSHHLWDEVTEANRQEIEKALNDRIRAAYVSAKMRGDLPAGLDLIIKDLLKSKINWKEMIFRSVSSVMPFEPSYERPHKRSHACGCYLPYIKKESVDVIVSFDSSGSVSQEDATKFLSEIVGMARQFHNINMVIVVCDCVIQTVLPVRNGNIKTIMGLKIKGRGGTSHVPMYEWCKKNKRDASLLINFTDGFTEFPDPKDVNINTLWVITKEGANFDDIPFGKKIRMDD